MNQSRVIPGQTRPLRVVIAGGSLGGLYAGLALRCIGCQVEIFERSGDHMVERGAGLVFHEDMLAYLAEHGIALANEVSVPIRQRRYLNRDGTTAAISWTKQNMTSWNVLYKQLRNVFPDANYHLNEELVSFEQSDNVVHATFKSGKTIEGDLLICADGTHSLSRSILLPQVKPEYAGYVAWRGVLAECDLLQEIVDELKDRITFYQMPQSHILTYLIPGADGSVNPGERRFNWVWYINRSIGEELDELLFDNQGNQREFSIPQGFLREVFVQWIYERAKEMLPTVFREEVLATKEPFIQPIFDVSVPQMVFGRICLLGDAAFVVRPHTAAGTYKASIAAIDLAESLYEHRGDVKAALRAWEPKQMQFGYALERRGKYLGGHSQL
ncbi:FAD binding domain-containing protein [Legionella fallonii]|uniref:2-polyprenyl-6-methoxyphenol hydroxylase-like oxidoreductase n=1 Tax=Legionella fallonii LLAP-10 TaxID=1212491 RepID=A0A098G7U4_9GAMM|nr:FAD binding domain-containing protein [Legionella fallonii]CEG58523.1 2-polyprenyl-6-methoxyphenol hydroxylase-like oxidoreductase [Legionella fallonii LLAP-10]